MGRALVPRRKLPTATCCALLLAALAAGSALAANGAKNPLVFVLRPADFPAKADPVDAGPMPASFARKLRAIRAVGRGAQYFASIPFGPERSQTVYGLVVTTPSVSQARKVFAWQKRTLSAGLLATAISLSATPAVLVVAIWFLHRNFPWPNI